jgi:hypothetical protein
MTPQPENTIDSGTLQSKPRRSKPDRRWTLLFIGDHGRVITLKRFKGIVLFTGLIFVFSVAAIVLLYWYNQSINKNNEKLQTSLDLFQKRIRSLRHEKEILMARLVLAESRMKDSIDDTGEILTPKPWLAKKQTEPSQKEISQAAVKQKATPVVNPPAKPKPVAETQIINLSVSVEKFNILKLSDPNKIKIEFKIKNTSPNSQRVAGHAIVVLKGDDLQPKMWLSVPPTGLVEGKPTGHQRGHGFAINYFRTMRFTANAPQPPDQYNKAAVYVYTANGRLLLEQEFPAEIPVPEPKIPEPSSTGSALPAPTLADPKEGSQKSQADDPPAESGERSPLY